ncbi:MAG: UDP-N-acetylmuramoyl-tripeptide--D-alanyl-D-alanine ligase [Deltaproteobacteria bacterium]|jgi:UDP-N-acetylmuramoyl-tripeptide--D-alanyl-D-alanine ligase|nr:UDP-N-acetylmuramoyl-tripeptide--D-alanyl-D-alanine ligase [Deltaproteobacteria bacterium]
MDGGGGRLASGPGLASLGLRLAEVAAFLRGAAAGPEGPPVGAVATDSRLAGPGAVFGALQGERLDGHDFVPAALDGGALAAVVREGFRGPADERRLIRVPDTLAALGLLARAVRDRVGARVVAVTGSVGKTTVKELLGAILGQECPAGALVLSPGNFNNQVGLPLTLLSQGAGTTTVVAELGASGFGEIAALARMARPDVGLVTVAGQAHLESFGSVEGVARAKAELYAALGPGAVAVVNAGDGPMMAQAAALAAGKAYFGLAGTLAAAGLLDQGVALAGRRDLGAGGQELALRLPGGQAVETLLRLPGEHNALNAAAAAAAALAAGAPARANGPGRGTARPVPGRLRMLRGRGGRHLIDDSYNANPTSVAAALGFLGSLSGFAARGAILGDMLELGGGSGERHFEAGLMAARAGLSWLALVGGQAGQVARGALAGGLGPEGLAVFATPAEAAAWVDRVAPRGSVTLVKGSRAIGLERAVLELAEEGPAAQGAGAGNPYF